MQIRIDSLKSSKSGLTMCQCEWNQFLYQVIDKSYRANDSLRTDLNSWSNDLAWPTPSGVEVDHHQLGASLTQLALEVILEER